MGFSAKQMQALRRSLDSRHVRTREANGRELSYIEGWYVISEANRIFGFDGWSRETVESRCVLARENRGTFPRRLYRQGAHHRARRRGDHCPRRPRLGRRSWHLAGRSPRHCLKAAETDATKRALATFGKPFGLELYRKDKKSALQGLPPLRPATASPPTSRVSVHTPTIRHRSRGRRITTGGATKAR